MQIYDCPSAREASEEYRNTSHMNPLGTYHVITTTQCTTKLSVCCVGYSVEAEMIQGKYLLSSVAVKIMLKSDWIDQILDQNIWIWQAFFTQIMNKPDNVNVFDISTHNNIPLNESHAFFCSQNRFRPPRPLSLVCRTEDTHVTGKEVTSQSLLNTLYIIIGRHFTHHLNWT